VRMRSAAYAPEAEASTSTNARMIFFMVFLSFP
jgi:hypothetical protein